MKRFLSTASALLLVCCLVSWTHKFYVSIYQLEYNAGKNRLELGCRIFADDLDKALERKYGGTFHFAEGKTTGKELEHFRDYLSEHLIITSDSEKKSFSYKTWELKDHVMISYWIAEQDKAPKSIRCTNRALFEIDDSQQNIIQGKVLGVKKSLLLTADTPSGLLEF